MQRLPSELVDHIASGWLGARDRGALRGTCRTLRACVAPPTDEQRHHARFWQVLNEMVDALYSAPSGRIDDPRGWAAMHEISKTRENRRDVYFERTTRNYKTPRGRSASSHPDLRKAHDIYMSPRKDFRKPGRFRLCARLKLTRLFGAALTIEATLPDASAFLTYSAMLDGWRLDAYATDGDALTGCLAALRDVALIEADHPVARHRIVAVRMGHLQHRFRWGTVGGLPHPWPYRAYTYGQPVGPEFEAVRARLESEWRAELA